VPLNSLAILLHSNNYDDLVILFVLMLNVQVVKLQKNNALEVAREKKLFIDILTLEVDNDRCSRFNCCFSILSINVGGGE
jgi:hypothetical protein